jgi:hypothetical protein
MKLSSLGRLCIETPFLQLHHKAIFLARFFENAHGFLKIHRVVDSDFDHSTHPFTDRFLVLFLKMSRYRSMELFTRQWKEGSGVHGLPLGSLKNALVFG